MGRSPRYSHRNTSETQSQGLAFDKPLHREETRQTSDSQFSSTQSLDMLRRKAELEFYEHLEPGRNTRRSLIRHVSKEDKLLYRGANPRTGVISESDVANFGDSETIEKEEFYSAIDVRWYQRGDEWIGLTEKQTANELDLNEPQKNRHSNAPPSYTSECNDTYSPQATESHHTQAVLPFHMSNDPTEWSRPEGPHANPRFTMGGPYQDHLNPSKLSHHSESSSAAISDSAIFINPRNSGNTLQDLPNHAKQPHKHYYSIDSHQESFLLQINQTVVSNHNMTTMRFTQKPRKENIFRSMKTKSGRYLSNLKFKIKAMDPMYPYKDTYKYHDQQHQIHPTSYYGSPRPHQINQSIYQNMEDNMSSDTTFMNTDMSTNTYTPTRVGSLDQRMAMVADVPESVTNRYKGVHPEDVLLHMRIPQTIRRRPVPKAGTPSIHSNRATSTQEAFQRVREAQQMIEMRRRQYSMQNPALQHTIPKKPVGSSIIDAERFSSVQDEEEEILVQEESKLKRHIVNAARYLTMGMIGIGFLRITMNVLILFSIIINGLIWLGNFLV